MSDFTAAVNSVVDTWQMPPPTSSVTSPLEYAVATLKPRSVVRSPTVSLNENVSPGSSRVPLISSSDSAMFVSRFELDDEAFVTA